MSKVNVAVIGYGHLGKWHSQKANGLKDANLVAIVESYGPNQKAAREAYPDVKIVSSIDEVMNEIDAAVVVTPTSTHFELVDKLLSNSKHVFCEKPLCSTHEECLKLEDKVNDRTVQVGHSERCHQAWDVLKDDFKALPAKKMVKITRFAEFKGRATDVDVVQDLMIHDIDLMLHLFGEQPMSVSSLGHKIRTDKWDHVTSHFFFASGMEVIITSGRNHIKEVRELEVMSSNGCISVDLFKNEIHFGTNTKFEDDSYVKTQSYEKRDHLNIEQESFYKSILNKSEPMVTYKDGVNAVYLVTQVLKSLEIQADVKL